MVDTQADGDKVLHQDSVEEVIDDHLTDASLQEAIDDLAAASNSYSKVEADEVRDTLNSVLGILRDAKLLPSE